MLKRTITLDRLFASLHELGGFRELPAVPVSGIAIDSRLVTPGDLFVAMKGASTDGHDFIRDAIARGAAAVVGQLESLALDVPYIRLADTRKALTWVAAAFYGWPARSLTVIGVTGTDGKTTTVNLLHSILDAAGIRSGMISSVNAVIGTDVLDTGFHVTTPDAHDVQRFLAQMVDAGLTHVVLETTSHGWAQHRIDACEFDIGVVTNITHEHLDEHGTYANYRAAKARLITSLGSTLEKGRGSPRLAVLNRDDSSFQYLSSLTPVRVLGYGLSEEADLRALDIEQAGEGIAFVALGPGFRVAISTHLTGHYNVSNCLAALGAAVVGLSIDPGIAAVGLRNLGGVAGRMESIELGQDFRAIVDFAHTPNALRVTLEAARRIVERDSAHGRVIVVFGSAGLRDREKRRMMAETAAELADLTILTAEDPRVESLGSILAEMAQGAGARGAREGDTFWRIPDRGDAIRFALQLARHGDIVLACGKGHEQSMCFGKKEYPWDDRVAMRAALAERLGMPGPMMPYLPTQDREESDWLLDL